jgi:hypothetical protein
VSNYGFKAPSCRGGMLLVAVTVRCFHTVSTAFFGSTASVHGYGGD